MVKLMGRYSGFIAASAALASREVNFVLIPESDFDLEGPGGLLAALEKRLEKEGMPSSWWPRGRGKNILADLPQTKDPSGNIRLKDIGIYLAERIQQHFARSQRRSILNISIPVISSAASRPIPTIGYFAVSWGSMPFTPVWPGKPIC